ncbi:unnamed protein product [Cladocopium goreaui]|uniref:Uncharacterized protein n=1 Tax=Cladocopium goreaui TaxID=2562237 RepID=A0A9P1FZP4_9DINO|nr:unnamed protein product [Cladocopium goreaui]CAI4002608.1 unnamed protein product [Cladocopium goreaui]
MGQPEAILPDSCHCFHLGWGIDLGSSALVLLAYDTALVLQWLEDFLEPDGGDDLVQGLKYALATANLFFRTLRSCGVFIEGAKKELVFFAGQQMCEAYGHMATKCFHLGWKMFRLRPKLHFQQHLTLLMGPESGPIAFSALNFSCWADEDYIGRISRLSRSVHPLKSSYRCLQKALGLYKCQFQSIQGG